MDLAVSKYPDLLICERTLYSIRVASQVLLCIAVVVIFMCSLCCRRDQWFVAAWEVGRLEGLQVFLRKCIMLVRVLVLLGGI